MTILWLTRKNKYKCSCQSSQWLNHFNDIWYEDGTKQWEKKPNSCFNTKSGWLPLFQCFSFNFSECQQSYYQWTVKSRPECKVKVIVITSNIVWSHASHDSPVAMLKSKRSHTSNQELCTLHIQLTSHIIHFASLHIMYSWK